MGHVLGVPSLCLPVVAGPRTFQPSPKSASRRVNSHLLFAAEHHAHFLVGDLEADKAEAQARKYFERIPRGPENSPDGGRSSETARGEAHGGRG